MEKHMMNKQGTLTPEAAHVIQEQGTELPNTGHYNLHDENGTYLCRQCGLALFRDSHKFISACGWPSFDDELDNTIRRLPDPDGRRTEIRCNRCDGHLGHIFQGEHYTDKNQRYCVNSLSVDFANSQTINDSEEAIVAGGCFWGVEHLLKLEPGVVFAEVGYTGGELDHPQYEHVKTGQTGHFEALRIIFDPALSTYEAVIKAFLEAHDPSQTNGQGPDIGTQYQSAVFYYDASQQKIAEALLKQLEKQGMQIATRLLPVNIFWPAENHHQAYFSQHTDLPVCHQRVKRFEQKAKSKN
jgi:peptide methionine sulfoxide reductase msrA/msrB